MLGLTCWPNHHYVGNIFFQLCKNKKKGEGEEERGRGEERHGAWLSPLLTCPSPQSVHQEHVGSGGASVSALWRGLPASPHALVSSEPGWVGG